MNGSAAKEPPRQSGSTPANGFPNCLFTSAILGASWSLHLHTHYPACADCPSRCFLPHSTHIDNAGIFASLLPYIKFYCCPTPPSRFLSVHLKTSPPVCLTPPPPSAALPTSKNQTPLAVKHSTNWLCLLHTSLVSENNPGQYANKSELKPQPNTKAPG